MMKQTGYLENLLVFQPFCVWGWGRDAGGGGVCRYVGVLLRFEW